MVGHQAPAQYAHGQPRMRLGDHAEEGLVVVVLVKNGGATVAAVEYVVADVADTGASGAGDVARRSA